MRIHTHTHTLGHPSPAYQTASPPPSLPEHSTWASQPKSRQAGGQEPAPDSRGSAKPLSSLSLLSVSPRALCGAGTARCRSLASNQQQAHPASRLFLPWPLCATHSPEAQVPASERHGALVGEAWPLAPELPPTSLPGPWAAPLPPGLHQVSDGAFFHLLPVRSLQQGSCRKKKASQASHPQRLMQRPGLTAGREGQFLMRWRSHSFSFSIHEPMNFLQPLHCSGANGTHDSHLANYTPDFMSF